MSAYEKYYINFENMKPQIIEAFASIYGEKHRETIIQRLQHLHVNTYITAEDLQRYMNDIETRKKGELTIRFFEQIGIELSVEQREGLAKGKVDRLSKEQRETLQMCFGGFGLNIYTYSHKFANFNVFLQKQEYEGLTEAERSMIDTQKVIVLNMLGANVTEDDYREKIADGSLSHILEQIEVIRRAIADADKEYLIFQEKYSEEFAEIERCKQIQEQLKRQSTVEYLQEISPLLSKEEQDRIETAIEKGRLSFASDYMGYGRYCL